MWKEAFPEEDCVEAKGAQIPKTACILQGFVLIFPLGNQVRFQHLSSPFPTHSVGLLLH